MEIVASLGTFYIYKRATRVLFRTEYDGVSALQENISMGDAWLYGMATAAAGANLTVQVHYHMSLLLLTLLSMAQIIILIIILSV